MQQIRAITLDLDDTLWAIAPVIERAEAALWAWLRANYPLIGECFSEARAAELRAQVMQDHWHKNHDFRFLRKKVLARMAEQSGYSDALVDDAFDVFDAERNRVDLFPDVEPALATLCARFTVIAVTNGNACLDRIGIRHLFHDVITAAEVGAAKPARPIFREALKRAGVDAHQVLHVGDHPEADIAGAAGAGLRTAWVNRVEAEWPEHIVPPDVTVRCMAELRELLEVATGSS